MSELSNAQAPWTVPFMKFSDADERELRERAMSHACYISPEMGAFADEDAEYMARLIKTADRIADWIKDGV